MEVRPPRVHNAPQDPGLVPPVQLNVTTVTMVMAVTLAMPVAVTHLRMVSVEQRQMGVPNVEKQPP